MSMKAPTQRRYLNSTKFSKLECVFLISLIFGVSYLNWDSAKMAGSFLKDPNNKGNQPNGLECDASFPLKNAEREQTSLLEGNVGCPS